MAIIIGNNEDFYFLFRCFPKYDASLSASPLHLSLSFFVFFSPLRATSSRSLRLVFFKPAGRFHGAPFTAKFVTLNWRARAPRCLSRPLMRLAHREISVVSFFIVLALRHPLHGRKRNDGSFLRSSLRLRNFKASSTEKHKPSINTFMLSLFRPK